MRYDNLEIKDVIDRCVEGILQEDDKEFLSHTNWESEWIFLLARKIYEALSPDPSFSHQSLEAAARGRRFSISLNDSHLVYCGSSIPTGFLLTIDCHFPYIREKSKELMWEYERRGLIREIETIAKEYGMI